MKKALKFIFVAALVVLMLATVVACGGDKGGTKATPTPNADGTTSALKANFTKPGEKYSFWSYQFKSENPYSGNTEREQQMNDRVLNLEEKYSIDISFYVASGTAGSELLRQSAFQGMPEVTGMKENGLYSMMDTYLYNNNPGACIEPLSDHEDVYDFRNDEKFNVFSQYDLCEYQKKLWFFIPDEIGIDFEVGGNCLLFNKKMVQAAGYDPKDIYAWVDAGTWNWEKFEEVLVACNNPERAQFAIERGNSGLFMWSLANGNNTEFVECVELPNGQKQDSFVYTGEKGQRLMEAYDEFLKLANDLKVMETSYYAAGSTDPADHFMSGDVAWYYTGFSSNCFYKQIETMEEDYGIVPWPKGKSVSATDPYHSMYPHLNPYCVFRNKAADANIKGAVQILCELFTPIYDKNSEDAVALYETEISQYSRDDESAKNLDMIEKNKIHFRVFMYSNAPCLVGDLSKLEQVLFGKGEDAILAQEKDAKTYFESIADTINNSITKRSPYTWKE